MKTLFIMVILMTTGCASFQDRVTDARQAAEGCEGNIMLKAIQTDGDREKIELVCEWSN